MAGNADQSPVSAKVHVGQFLRNHLSLSLFGVQHFGDPFVGHLDAEVRVFGRRHVGKPDVPVDAPLFQLTRGIQFGIGIDLEIDHRALRPEIAHEGAKALGNVLDVGFAQRSIDGPLVSEQDGIHHDVGGAHAGHERPFGIGGQRAVSPETIAALADDRGDMRRVEQIRAGGFVAVGVVDRTGSADDLGKFLVRRRRPESVFSVGAGEQAGGDFPDRLDDAANTQQSVIQMTILDMNGT